MASFLLPSAFLAFPVAAQLTLCFTILVLILISAGYILFRSKNKPPVLPSVGTAQDSDYRSAIEEGDHLPIPQYPDSPYILNAPIRIIILPNCMLEKVGSLPETQVSAMKEVYRRGLGQYTDLGTPLPDMFAAIKVDLTRHVRDFVPILQEEARYAFEKLVKFEDTQQWISTPAFKTSKRLVAMLNACAFIGPPLSRENSWVDAMYNYSDDLKQTFLTLERFPTWTWPLLHPFLFKFLHINERRKMIEEKLRPIVAQQNSRHDMEGDQGQKTKFPEVGYQGSDHPKTLFNWVRERLGRQKADDIKLHARIQLRAALAGMDTVSHALTNVIYDLAAYPEYVEPLREEIVSAIGTAKIWSKPAMEKLDKMDSFIKESMRVNPMYLLTMSRAVTSPLSLDENTTLQKGTLIAFSQQAAHFSSEKQHCDDPNKFDGFRYSRLRAELGMTNKYLFATTGPDHTTFGHGRDSCPGRFFAATVLKVIITHLLLNYDLRFLPGSKRPKNRYYGPTVAVDRMAEVMLKRRVSL